MQLFIIFGLLHVHVHCDFQKLDRAAENCDKEIICIMQHVSIHKI